MFAEYWKQEQTGKHIVSLFYNSGDIYSDKEFKNRKSAVLWMKEFNRNKEQQNDK